MFFCGTENDTVKAGGTAGAAEDRDTVTYSTPEDELTEASKDHPPGAGHSMRTSPAAMVGSTRRHSSPIAARHAVIATASNNNLFT